MTAIALWTDRSRLVRDDIRAEGSCGGSRLPRSARHAKRLARPSARQVRAVGRGHTLGRHVAQEGRRQGLGKTSPQPMMPIDVAGQPAAQRIGRVATQAPITAGVDRAKRRQGPQTAIVLDGPRRALSGSAAQVLCLPDQSWPRVLDRADRDVRGRSWVAYRL